MKNVRTVTTDWKRKKYWEEQTPEVTCQPDVAHMLQVYPELTQQRIEGFGGAFTEASAVSFRTLTEAAREAFLEGYFFLFQSVVTVLTFFISVLSRTPGELPACPYLILYLLHLYLFA